MEKETTKFIMETSERLQIGEVSKIEEIEHRVYSQKKRYVVSPSKGKFFFKFYEKGFVKDYVSFLDFLTQMNFPTTKMITTQPIISPNNTPVLVYEFLNREMKCFLNKDELRGTSQLIARLHLESDTFYIREQSQKDGLTHGDLKLQNLISNENNKPILIDFEKIKSRSYISDVIGFLFFGTLSDIYNKYLSFDRSNMRKKVFIGAYEDYRKVRLYKRELAEHINQKRNWFVKWVDENMGKGLHKDKELIGKKDLVNIVCEVLV